MIKPAQRYICSHPGCTAAMEYAAGVMTRDAALWHVRHEGFQVEMGECLCRRHSPLQAAEEAERLTILLRASVAVNEARDKRASNGNTERDLLNYGSRKLGYGR